MDEVEDVEQIHAGSVGVLGHSRAKEGVEGVIEDEVVGRLGGRIRFDAFEGDNIVAAGSRS